MKNLNIRLDLGFRRLVPEWKKLFAPKYLKEDIVAGVTVACVAVPLSLAIALASGVDPAVGLVTAIIAGVVCALFNGTPLAVSGPAAAMAVLIAANVEQHGLGGLLVIGAVCGILQILSGVFGIGQLARLVPGPVVGGFTAGIGAIILIGQLPRALGLPPPPQSHVISVVTHIGQLLHAVHPWVLGLTILTIVIAQGLPKILPRIPAPLIAVVIPSLIATFLKLDIPVIGNIPSSLPSPHLPNLIAISDWNALLASAVVVFALASLETLLSSSAVDKMAKGERHDPNQELIGQGLGNIAVALFGGIPVTGVIARSSLNVIAGGKTRRAAIFHSVALLGVVFLVAPVISRIPVAALAGLLLSIAINMLNPGELKHLWHTARGEAMIYLITFFTILFTDLLVGVQAGVIISLLIAVFRLGRMQVWWHSGRGGSPRRLVLSGPLSFLSASKIEALRSEADSIRAGEALVIDFAGVEYMDTTGASLLVDFAGHLKLRGSRVVVAFAEPRFEKILRSLDTAGAIGESYAVGESEIYSLIEDRPHHFDSGARGRVDFGVERFRREAGRRYAPLLAKLAEGQKPHTLFITCCDSRISPNLITQTDPGELFTMRNIGNVVPRCGDDPSPAEGAAIEYSVGVLGVKQIIVCGHSSCGAIAAALSPKGVPPEYANVGKWIELMRGLIPGLADTSSTDQAAMLNVLYQTKNLMTYPIVKERIDSGELSIRSWFLDLGKIEVKEWNHAREEFTPVGRDHAAPFVAKAAAAKALV